jgi:hypothetical protein
VLGVSDATVDPVSARDRTGLMDRIRQIRRQRAATDPSPPPGSPSHAEAQPNLAALRALEQRLTHLEQLVEGLQDAVHREWQRQGKQIADLDARTQPAALGAALSKNARERGL